MDQTDRRILRVLSLYQDLDLLQLWYELGESGDQVQRMAAEEILGRLKSLTSRGLVKCLMEGEEDIRYALTSQGGVELLPNRSSGRGSGSEMWSGIMSQMVEGMVMEKEPFE